MKIKYHFFGKDCIIDRNLINREDTLQSLVNKGFKYNELLFVNQIHGSEVVVVDDVSKIFSAQNLPKADAIVTNLKNIAIAVFTADCAPILLFDEENSVIAIAHAGWRGARSGVIKNTILEMKKLDAKNIKAVIGPMIAQESYHITEEFFDEFLRENNDNKKFFKATAESGCYLFDLVAYVTEKLKAEQVFDVQNTGLDTCKNENDFFSYRRSSKRGEKDCGRNVSVIMIS